LRSLASEAFAPLTPSLRLGGASPPLATVLRPLIARSISTEHEVRVAKRPLG
jgi:hypothetical protein